MPEVSEKMPKILNFGSMNLDYVYSVDHFVREGETVPSSDLQIFCGGKGLNQSIALARAGAKVYHAGFVGENDGEPLLEKLEKSGVNTELIEKRSVPSGHAIIQVDASGQNCILLHGGANQTNSEDDIKRALSGFGKGDYLLLQNEINLGGKIIEEAKKREMTVILNPSPIDEKIFEFPLGLVDFLILNEVEAAVLCKLELTCSSEQLTNALPLRFSNLDIVLTLGSRGACYIEKGAKNIVMQETFPVEAIDTTAAGDTFTGYFFAGIMSGSLPVSALKTASAAAALAVSKKGAAASIPALEEVKAFLTF